MNDLRWLPSNSLRAGEAFLGRKYSGRGIAT